MKDTNICKIPITNTSEDFSIKAFVLESNIDVMRARKRLKYNRMLLITDGRGDIKLGDKTFPVCCGTLIFGFEGETFSLIRGEDIQYIYIDFSGSRGSSLCYRFGISASSRKLDSFESLIPFLRDSLVRTPPENIDIAGEGVLLYVLSRLSRDTSSQSDIIKRILEYTDESFRDPDLSISQISDEIGYNSKYLSHLFKKKMNMNFSEYLRSLRLKYAISLFELGLSSIKNVALLSGFRDPLYFSTTFKRAIGASPKEFIKNNKK